jgi:hypothetical protein
MWMMEPTILVKPANRKLLLALVALFAITLVGLSIAIAAYYSEMNSKNAQINQLNDQIAGIQAQIANLTLPVQAPNLIGVGMQYTDNRTNPNAPFLHVTGYIVNVGTAKANNCRIHPYAIQSGNNTAIDSSTAINSLNPGASEQISIQFPYTGSALMAYSSNLNWGT